MNTEVESRQVRRARERAEAKAKARSTVSPASEIDKANSILMSDFTSALVRGVIDEDKVISIMSDLHSYHAFSIVVPEKYLDFITIAYNTDNAPKEHPGYENSVLISNKEKH